MPAPIRLKTGRLTDTLPSSKKHARLEALAGQLKKVVELSPRQQRNIMNHVSLQSFFDEGASFTAAARLTSQPFSSQVGFGSKEDLPTLGSRLALASTDDRALAVWTDTRAGTVASNKQDVARAVVAFSEPERLSPGAQDGLRYGGIALMVLGLGMLLAGLLGVISRRAST